MSLLQALVKKDPIRRQVLRVKGCLAGSKAENLLEQGDMVLAINKEPVTCFCDVEYACQALADCNDIDNNGELTLTIFRQVFVYILFLVLVLMQQHYNSLTSVRPTCNCIYSFFLPLE